MDWTQCRSSSHGGVTDVEGRAGLAGRWASGHVPAERDVSGMIPDAPARGVRGESWAVGNEVRAGKGPIGGERTMESYPRQAGALVTVVAVEESHVVVADADGVRHRARCIPRHSSPESGPLKP